MEGPIYNIESCLEEHSCAVLAFRECEKNTHSENCHPCLIRETKLMYCLVYVVLSNTFYVYVHHCLVRRFPPNH